MQESLYILVTAWKREMGAIDGDGGELMRLISRRTWRRRATNAAWDGGYSCLVGRIRLPRAACKLE
jgi:hypothetical protein